MTEKRGMKALEAWCRKVTNGYRDVKINNMTTAWRDGMAFCAIIHHFQPDLIDFDSLCKDNIFQNNDLAFSMAERLGIPALLDAEDMVSYKVPDKLSILTYVSQLYQHFHALAPAPSPAKRPLEVNEDAADTAETPEKRPAVEAPAAARPPPSVPRTDVCQACRNRVYILERLIVDNKLYHRTCFKCLKCAAVLSPGSYVECDLSDRYECIQCPLQEEKQAKNRLSEAVLKRFSDTANGDGSRPASQSAAPWRTEIPLLEEAPKPSVIAEAAARARSRFHDQNLNHVGPEDPALLDTGQTLPELPRKPVGEFSDDPDAAASGPRHDSHGGEAAPPAASDHPSAMQTSGSGCGDLSSDVRNNNVRTPPSAKPPLPPGGEAEPSRGSAKPALPQKPALLERPRSLPIQRPNHASMPDSEPEPAARKSVQVISSEAVLETTKLQVRVEVAAEAASAIDAIDAAAEREVLAGDAVPNDGSAAIEASSSDAETEATDVVDGAGGLGPDLSTAAAPDPAEDSGTGTGKACGLDDEAGSGKPDVVEDVPAVSMDHSADSGSGIGDRAASNKPDGVEAPGADRVDASGTDKASGPGDEAASKKSGLVPVAAPRASRAKRQQAQVPAKREPRAAPAPALPRRHAAPAPTPPKPPRNAEQPDYPEDLNPFGDDEEPAAAAQEEPQKKKPSLNPFGDSDDDDGDGGRQEPEVKKLPEPVQRRLVPCYVNPFSSDSEGDSEGSSRFSASPAPSPHKAVPASSATMRKKRPAPRPPAAASPGITPQTTPRPAQRNPPPPPKRIVVGPDEAYLTEKSLKELDNRNRTRAGQDGGPAGNQLSPDSLESTEPVELRSPGRLPNTFGNWKRKKKRAPPLPGPRRRQVATISIKDIQAELLEIEEKHLELESRGVEIEKSIREKFNDEIDPSVEEEDLIIQLFDLVNKKNELFRRQTELTYLKRQQRLEEEHADLEYQIRCLMEKSDDKKTDEDRALEDRLIARLVEVVTQRSEIIESMEMDRVREAEEDQSLQQQHLGLHVCGSNRGSMSSQGSLPASVAAATVSPPGKDKSLKKKKKKDKDKEKEKKKKSLKDKDEDKDTDETESRKKTTPKDKPKKKWF